MAIAPHIKNAMASSSWIRKMFEEGNRLRSIHGAENVYDFSLGNPDLEPPAEVTAAIQKVAASDDKGRHGYMPNAGYESARAAMAKKVSKEQGSPLESQHVIMSSGAAGALNAVFKAILSPGDEVLVSAPFFAEYTQYCANHNATLKPIPSKSDFSPDTDAIAAALSNKTAAVLINSPNNPTGKIYTTTDIEKLTAVLKAHGKKTSRFPYLIADEPYRDITYGGRTVAPIFPLYESAIIVSSFAKNLSLPGERIGFIAINPTCPDANDLFAACVFSGRVLGFVNAPAFFQKVVALSWEAKGDYSLYEKRRDALTKVLRAANITYAEPEGAFYLFCTVPQKSDGTADDITFCEHLKNHRVLGVPGTGFGMSGYFRLAYCVAESSITNSAAAFKTAHETWT